MDSKEKLLSFIDNKVFIKSFMEPLFEVIFTKTYPYIYIIICIFFFIFLFIFAILIILVFILQSFRNNKN
uniref:Uncharacterized protein n=1 Tax=viral metagenome TaxID=1070528 RepID=A0A6C0H6B2_9ZZZZ